MPVYEFKCDPCNSRVDRLLPMEHGVQSCPSCDTEMKKMVTMPAFTPGHWGDSKGWFDRGLGMHINNFAHRDRVMKQKGLRPAVASELTENRQDMVQDHTRHEKNVSTFKAEMDKTGSFRTAVAKTFPHKQ